MPFVSAAILDHDAKREFHISVMLYLIDSDRQRLPRDYIIRIADV